MIAAAGGTAFQHDYRLEPPDEVIAELQSSVVQYRLRGALGRADLIRDMVRAVGEVVATGDSSHAIQIAAIALRMRMEAT